MITVQGLARRAQNVWKRTGVNPHGETGWTEIPPLNVASGAKEFFVHATAGVDNTGPAAGSEGFPFRTINHAKMQCPPGRGNRIWLARGQTWNEDLGTLDANFSGPGADDPFIIGAYGNTDTERPKLNCQGTFVTFSAGDPLRPTVHDIWILDLEAYPDNYTGASDRNGAELASRTRGILIEGCYIHGFTMNVSAAAYDGKPQDTLDFHLKRSVIADAYKVGGHSGGMYGWKTHNLTIEDCVFDHNGWKEGLDGAEANVQNHNLYLAGNGGDDAGLDSFNTTIIGSLFASGSNIGAMVRCGGTVNFNVFARNSLGFLIGRNDNDDLIGGEYRRNFVIDGRDIINPDPPGGLTNQKLGFEFTKVEGATIHQNVCANASASVYQLACKFSSVGLSNIVGNIRLAWDGFENSSEIAGNTPANWAQTNTPPTPNDFGDTGVYPDDDRSLGEFATLMSLGSTHDDLLVGMRALRKGAWVDAYSPRALNAWLLQGFGL